MASAVNVADHESVEENTLDKVGGSEINNEEQVPVCTFGFDIKDRLTDLTLIVEDRRLYVNRGVLEVSSSVLRDMFESKLEGKEETVVEIPDVKYKQFAEFLACMYPTKQYRASQSNVLTILPLAYHYKVDFLFDESEVLLTSITSQTEDQAYLIRCFKTAKRLGLTTLRQHCFDLVVKKCRENVQTLDEEMDTDDKIAVFEELMPNLCSEACKIKFLSSDTENSYIQYMANFSNAKYRKENFNFLGNDVHRGHECLKTEIWGVNLTVTVKRTYSNGYCFEFTLSPDTDSFIGKTFYAAINFVFENNFPGKNTCSQNKAKMLQGSTLAVLFPWDTISKFDQGFQWCDKYTVVTHILVNKPQ